MPSPVPDTSFERWQALGRPGWGYEDWKRQQIANAGGGQTGGTAKYDSTVTIRHNGASTEPGISDAELVRRKRNEIGTFDRLTPDLADMALRDVSTGMVRKARKGSASSALGLSARATPFESALGEF